jgi:aminopeptidase N
LRSLVGRELGEELRTTYDRMIDRGPYDPHAESAGRRALKNICLDLLVATRDGNAIALAISQFEAADNMTDRMAALVSLSQHDVPQRAAALERFYAQFEGDPLVIDKWLALQAAIPEAATLPRVRTLMEHPAFSLANPNRVRALIGSFAMANQTQFNRVDGAGYQFLADIVLTLDARNPQVASRMMGAFKSWRALEPSRRAHAEAALRRVASAETLSRDVADMVRRSLADEPGASVN